MLRYFVLFLCLSSVFGKSILPEIKTRFSQISLKNLDPRILNGEDAQVGQFPWEVRILSVDPLLHGRYCNGAIISDQWILTTAYCLENAAYVLVIGGVVNMSNLDGGVFTLAQHGFIHENFDRYTLQNDIALLQTDEPLTLIEHVKAIALADEELEAGVVATISGWGDSGTDEDNVILQFANVTTIDNAECQKIYGDAIVPSMVCTAAGDAAPCFNDAGSPLVVNADSDPVLVAIFSFLGGENCGQYPAGYTRVEAYREWIREKIGI